jgi:hypothetical protein
LLSLGTAFAGPNFNPGKWEITTQTEMAGMPGMIPAVTHTQCLTGDVLVPQSEKDSEECKLKDIKVIGDTVTWNMVCSGRNGEMEGSGKIVYKGDTMTGEMNMVIKGAGMQLTNKISGRRIGKCD